MNGITHLFMPELDELTEEELAHMKIKATLEAQMQFKMDRLRFSVRKDCFKEF